MGDIAEMMLDGTLCECCGVFLNDEPQGYPCRCNDCREPKSKAAPPVKKVACDVCGRRVKQAGLNDHMRDAHGVTQ